MRQERLYRRLYDHVRGLQETEVDYSMDASAFAEDVEGWFGTVLRPTLLIFHGPVWLSIVVVMLALA